MQQILRVLKLVDQSNNLAQPSQQDINLDAIDHVIALERTRESRVIE